jgi:hypothetical protein
VLVDKENLPLNAVLLNIGSNPKRGDSAIGIADGIFGKERASPPEYPQKVMTLKSNLGFNLSINV